MEVIVKVFSCLKQPFLDSNSQVFLNDLVMLVNRIYIQLINCFEVIVKSIDERIGEV